MLMSCQAPPPPPPPRLKIWLEAQPPPAETGRGGGAHYAMGIDPAPF